MNAHPAIMRALYKHAEAGQEFPYSVHIFAGLPAFDGGCGVSSLRAVFEALGYEWLQIDSSKNHDGYTIKKC